ncbi:anti-sigma factor [Bacteroidia bacterium]|nr:anti-sigma factor [Bacteroidia bacterium]
MMQAPEYIEAIIIRTLQKAAGPEEEQQLNRWLREDKQNLELFCQMQELWEAGDSLSGNAIQKGWERLGKDINLPAKRRFLPFWFRYAAVACLGIMLAIPATFFLTPAKEKETIVRNVVYNRNGIGKITLPDGSVAWLNGKAKLSYPGTFGAGKRMVALEGKSFFEVQKNTTLPFIVQTDQMDVRVTGTSFFVQDETEGNATVTLVTGGVAIDIKDETGNTFKTYQLKPGQQIDYDKQSREAFLRDVNTTFYRALKDDAYRFTNETLEVIAQYLAIRFDTKIEMSPALKMKRFTGRITPEHTVKDVMDIINKSHPVAYRIENEAIHIREK